MRPHLANPDREHRRRFHRAVPVEVFATAEIDDQPWALLGHDGPPFLRLHIDAELIDDLGAALHRAALRREVDHKC